MKRPLKERIIGLRTNDATMAFVQADVREARLVQADVGSLPVVLIAAANNQPIAMFSRRVSGRVLSFRLIESMPSVVEDVETGTRWSLSDGGAAQGRQARARPRVSRVLVRVGRLLPEHGRLAAMKDDAKEARVKIHVRPSGPYVVEGDVTVVDWNGNAYSVQKRPFALCRCGGSTTKPFCDGTHSKAGFQAAEAAVPGSGDKPAV